VPSLEWKTDHNHGPVLVVAGLFFASEGEVAAAAGSRVFLYLPDGGEYRFHKVYEAGERIVGVSVLRPGDATEGLLVCTSKCIWIMGVVKGSFIPIQQFHPCPGAIITCVASGDVDADGVDEIILGTTQPDMILVFKMSGKFSALRLEQAGKGNTPGIPRLLEVIPGSGHNPVLAFCEGQGGRIARYTLSGGELLGEIVMEGHHPGVTALISGNFGPGPGSQMAVGSAGGQVWLMGAGQKLEVFRVTNSLGTTVSALAVYKGQPAGLMAGTTEGSVFVFNNPVQQKPELEFSPVEGVSGLAELPGGRVAVGTVIGGLQVWSLSAGGKNSGYIVKPGDTLKKISGAFGVSVDVLLNLNENIKNPDVILPGQMIKIPVAALHESQEV